MARAYRHGNEEVSSNRLDTDRMCSLGCLLLGVQSHPRQNVQCIFLQRLDAGGGLFSGLIGSALFQESVLAVTTGLAIGTILVLVIFWIWRNREQNRYTFWKSLSAFSLLILAATAVARGGKGLDAISPSKYVTFSVLLTIGVYVMSLRLARDHSGVAFSALPLGVCAGLIILSAPLSYYAGVERAEAIRMQSERSAFVLATYKNRTNACLEQAVHPQFWQPNITAKDGALHLRRSKLHGLFRTDSRTHSRGKPHRQVRDATSRMNGISDGSREDDCGGSHAYLSRIMALSFSARSPWRCRVRFRHDPWPVRLINGSAVRTSMAVSKPSRGADPIGLSRSRLGPASTSQVATSVAPFQLA